MSLLLVNLVGAALVVLLSSAAFAESARPLAQNQTAKVIAYVLLDKDSTSYLEQQLIPDVESGKIHIDRINLAFMDPSMDPATITNDAGDVQKLLGDAGILQNAPAGYGAQLKQDIATLQSQGVQVSFSVGGWAYSSLDPNQPSQNTSNFPLTPDIAAYFGQAGLTKNIDDVQKINSKGYTTKQYTDAWTAVAKAFGATGVDFDYEENWFAAETTFRHPVLMVDWKWPPQNPNGPYAIPYSVIKYAAYLKSLKESAAASHQIVSLAAPAAGAYNIYKPNDGTNFWCPVKDASGNSICGQGGTPASMGGNLKGIFYDMANYQTVNQTKTAQKYFQYPAALFQGLLGRTTSDNQDAFDTLGVMTYDLDDGYDGVGASWCIGKTGTDQHYTSRDPNTVGYKDIDCSIASQTQVITEMYKTDVMSAIQNPPHLAFGLEAGFPNYPMNIDPNLPGGGNTAAAIANDHYRWNDPFAAFGLVLKAGGNLSPLTGQFQQNLQTSDYIANAPDIHSQFLVLNSDFFNTMKTAGADSVIIWSLNNADFNEHLSKTSWDYQQLTAGNYDAFNRAYKKYGYSQTVLQTLFDNAASPEEIVAAANAGLNSSN